MKKTSALLLLAIMTISLAGCGGKKAGKINGISDLKGKMMGFVTPWVSTEEWLSANPDIEKGSVLFFNSQSELISALLGGKIDGAPCMRIQCNYYVQRNDRLKIIEDGKKVESSIVMALRSKGAVLRDQLDSALSILEGNGLLREMESAWIIDLPSTNEPMYREIPKIEGAKTIVVGVTGDAVPLDYIATDGKPAGFNVALLTQIGKILNVNFEFVDIETQAKFAALASNRIDVIFCHIVTENIPNMSADKVIMTKPYFTDRYAGILVRR